jgi:probable DNA metabolism protein
MSHETWAWDGSLESLLVLVRIACQEGDFPASLILPGRSGDELFAASAGLDRDAGSVAPEAAEESLAWLKSRQPRLCAAAYRAWMAEEEVEADLLEVAADCGQRGDLALADYGKPALSRLAASVRRVGKEINHLEGFARFSLRKDGIWACVIEPVHNILPALAPRFLGRFGDEAYSLCDLSRGYALWSAPAAGGGREIRGIGAEEMAAFLPDGSDTEDAELWRSYFRIVENQGRHNPLLQRSLMPRRYWKHLTEFGAF